MTAYAFDDVIVTPDTVPDAIDIEYPCEVCGREAGPYAGRGRKPKFCADHRKTSKVATPKVKGANATLAAQATEALVQLNNILTMPAMLFGYPRTASALATANDGFREMAYNALITDPALCAAIARGGSTGGKVALLIAYGMLASAVAPIALMEYRENKVVEEE
jgi:hypothetical protein